MRAKEFITGNSPTVIQEIAALNGKIDVQHWCELLEQAMVSYVNLAEAKSDQSLISAMSDLQQSYETPSVGNMYIPTFIMVIGDMIQVMDINGNIPSVNKARFAKVVGFNDGIIIFDNGLEWPNHRLTNLSFMATILCKTETQYNEFRSYMAMSHGVHLPEVQK